VRVQRIWLHFNVLLDLVLLLQSYLLHLALREVASTELALSEGRKFLAQLNILGVTVLFAFPIKSMIFCIVEFGYVILFFIENCKGFRSHCLTVGLEFTNLHLGSISQLLFLSIAPRIDLSFSLGFSLNIYYFLTRGIFLQAQSSFFFHSGHQLAIGVR
jgi:hypothetical protein